MRLIFALGCVLVFVQVEAWRVLVRNYHEDCSQQACNGAKNLTCIANKCECENDEKTGERWYYHEELQGCMPNVQDEVHPHQHHFNVNDKSEPGSKTLQQVGSVVGTPCNTSAVCIDGLGEHSRCSSKKLCECYDVTTGKWEVDVYEGKCEFKKKEGEPCKLESNECKLENKNLDCVEDIQNRGHGQCVCKAGMKCNSSGASTGILISFTLILMVFMAHTIVC